MEGRGGEGRASGGYGVRYDGVFVKGHEVRFVLEFKRCPVPYAKLNSVGI